MEMQTQIGRRISALVLKSALTYMARTFIRALYYFTGGQLQSVMMRPTPQLFFSFARQGSNCATHNKGGRVFVSGGGGGSIEPSGRTPPPKKGSIDRIPKIVLRLTPGPRR